jgi:predicted CoA-substrate-specific enzyme activase
MSTNGAIGFCLGASTVTAVVLDEDRHVAKVVRQNHEGSPETVFREIVETLSPGTTPILVTGRKFRHHVNLPAISETEATEYALGHLLDDTGTHYDAVLSAGGETFIAYILDHENRVVDISTGNKCASGTGEFFLQQIRRMGLDVDSAVREAATGSAYHVSGRCSVFCKSDCTHALNKGETIGDVTAGLCKMIAGKAIDLLARANCDRILMVGGTAQNNVVVDYITQEIPSITIPDEAAYFEALGAAVAAFERGKMVPQDLYKEKHSSFQFLEPLAEFEDLVEFAQAPVSSPQKGHSYILGLDVGSTTTKAVLLDTMDNTTCASAYLRTNGNPVEASRECYRSLKTQVCAAEGQVPNVSDVDIVGIGVTGSGRKIAGLFSNTDDVINEIIAHATAAIHFDPEVDTIFEIGGQDAKYTHITHGIPSDYAMNEACSAGTGSFLEEAALESLGIGVSDIADLSLRGKRPPNFSDQCSAFVSSDIKTATHEGVGREDILAGLVYSVGFNYLNRVKGNRPVGKKIFMQGGVCYNRAVPMAIAGIIKSEIVVPPDPGLMGAFGVALEVKKRIAKGTSQAAKIDLEALIDRTIEYGKSFTCRGGKERCDLKCQINRLVIDGHTYPFGGACDRYYNERIKKHPEEGKLNLVAQRNELLFEGRSDEEAAKQKVVGISTSFFTQRLFPLYREFFSYLGFNIVLSDSVNTSAINRQTSSMCFPGEVALGLFDNLLDKNPDILFLPHVKELYVPGGTHKPWFCSTCILSQGEPYWIGRAFADRLRNIPVVSPTLNFNGGWENGKSGFLSVASELGVLKSKAGKAFAAAIEAQREFEAETKELGRIALANLREHPDQIAVVLFGRSYNSLSANANKGIPKKLASRGYTVIPFEMLPYEDVPLGEVYGEYMHWEAGQRMLKAAEYIKGDPQLFGVFVTNFLCAPDSFIGPYFRRIMEKKPNLILELDAHTADAGINTRIEAFLDIVKNYRGIEAPATAHGPNGFKLATIKMENKGNFYEDSSGQRFPLSHESVKLILPSMGDLASRAVARACERFGIHTADLPVADSEALRIGRSVATGKECLPYMVCAGSLLKYIEKRPAEERTVLMMPKASGYCRFGQYHVALNYLSSDRKIENLAMLSLGMEEQWAGLGPGFSLTAWKAILISDIMDDIRNAIVALAVDPDEAMKQFDQEFETVCEVIAGRSKEPLYRCLEGIADRLRSIELRRTLDETAQIGLTGEIYVRRDHFSNLRIVTRLAQRGFLVKTAPVHEWVYYANYLIKRGLTQPDFKLPGYIEFLISDKVQIRTERRIKKIFATSGLYEPEIIDIEDTLQYVRHLISKELTGEPELITGMVLRDGLNHYAGVVCIGPFGCMQTRFAEAIASPVANVAAKREAWQKVGKDPGLEAFSDSDRIPFLTIESDGNPFPQLLESRFDSFCLQASRVAEKQGKKLAAQRDVDVTSILS